MHLPGLYDEDDWFAMSLPDVGCCVDIFGEVYVISLLAKQPEPFNGGDIFGDRAVVEGRRGRAWCQCQVDLYGVSLAGSDFGVVLVKSKAFFVVFFDDNL